MRNTKKKLDTVSALILFSVMLLITSDVSAVMIGLSTEELTKNSDFVVRGSVTDVKSQWSEDGKTIVSIAIVVVKDIIKGGLTESEIFVEYPGGEVGDIGVKVSDVAPIEKDEDVILFLKPKASGNIFNITGLAQGKYTIDSSGIARKGYFSIAGDSDMIDNDIPAEQLIEKIRRVQ